MCVLREGGDKLFSGKLGSMQQSRSRVNAVPCSARAQFSAVKVACHDLILL